MGCGATKVAHDQTLGPSRPAAKRQPNAQSPVVILSTLDDRLVAVLEAGDIRLLRVKWVESQPEAYGMQRRQELEALQYTVIKQDKYPKTDDTIEADFLTDDIPECDMIIFNPPFCLKTEFLQRACESGKPFIFICPVTIIETQKRFALFREHQLTILNLRDVPMSYIEIAKKISLKKHDVNNWFAMGIIGELFETGQVEKEIKEGKTKYKIPGREYIFKNLKRWKTYRVKNSGHVFVLLGEKWAEISRCSSSASKNTRK